MEGRNYLLNHGGLYLRAAPEQLRRASPDELAADQLPDELRSSAETLARKKRASGGVIKDITREGFPDDEERKAPMTAEQAADQQNVAAGKGKPPATVQEGVPDVAELRR